MSDEKPNLSWPQALVEAVKAFTQRPTTPLVSLYWLAVLVVLAAVVLACVFKDGKDPYVVAGVLGFAGLVVLGVLAFVAIAIVRDKTHHLQLGNVGPKPFMEIQAQQTIRQGDDAGHEYTRAHSVFLHVPLTAEERANVVERMLQGPPGTPLVAGDVAPLLTVAEAPDTDDAAGGGEDS